MRYLTSERSSSLPNLSRPRNLPFKFPGHAVPARAPPPDACPRGPEGMMSGLPLGAEGPASRPRNGSSAGSSHQSWVQPVTYVRTKRRRKFSPNHFLRISRTPAAPRTPSRLPPSVCRRRTGSRHWRRSWLASIRTLRPPPVAGAWPVQQRHQIGRRKASSSPAFDRATDWHAHKGTTCRCR